MLGIESHSGKGVDAFRLSREPWGLQHSALFCLSMLSYLAAVTFRFQDKQKAVLWPAGSTMALQKGQAQEAHIKSTGSCS